MSRSVAQNGRQTRGKGPQDGHFLTVRERQLLDQGPAPWERSDYHKRPSELDRRRHRQAYHKARRKAIERARGSLADLAWLAGSMEAEFVRSFALEPSPIGETHLETFLKELAAKVGMSPLGGDHGQRLLPHLLGNAIATGVHLALPDMPPPQMGLTFPTSHGAPALGPEVVQARGKPRPGRRSKR